jgi:calcineurin-like phosphoesterase family protein
MSKLPNEPSVAGLRSEATWSRGRQRHDTTDHRGIVKRPAAPGAHDLALCGHVHNAWRVRDGVVNVGVDVLDFQPVRIADALAARERAVSAATQ